MSHLGIASCKGSGNQFHNNVNVLNGTGPWT